jgi:hypothetical protein
VVANPPYISNKGMNSAIKQYVRQHYPLSKSDIFSCFIERSIGLTSSGGRLGFIAPYVWMFLSSYEEFRGLLLHNTSLTSLIQLEYNAFAPAMIPVATFTLMRNHIDGFSSSCIKLSVFKGHQNQAPKTVEAIRDSNCGWRFKVSADDFGKIPGKPFAFWVPTALRDSFESQKRLGDLAKPVSGMFTCDNNRFLRYWHEVSVSSILLPDGDRQQAGNARYYPYNKGGGFRRWAGNFLHLVDLNRDGDMIREYRKSVGQSYALPGQNMFFRQGATWNDVTSGAFSARLMLSGFIFDKCAPTAFFDKHEYGLTCLAVMNSVVMEEFTRLLNPTLHFTLGDFGNVPLPDHLNYEQVARLASRLVRKSEADWNFYEYSWDFQESPLLSPAFKPASTVEASYSKWIEQNKQAIAEVMCLEEENNLYLINAYGLADELCAGVPVEQVSLTTNPAYRYGGALSNSQRWDKFREDTLSELLSYSLGCMFDRYSLEQPGLILADSCNSQAEQLTAYEEKVGKPLSEVQFKPDPDGIIPVLDGEWFEDDIVARSREFLRVCFPASSLNTDLAFIETALAKDLRKYFCTDFYKDHLQTYKKRPIYWLLQSPAGPSRGGFACLIYLHRYTKDTLNLVLNNYFRPYLQKLEARQAQLGLDQLNDALPTRDRTAARKEAEKITKVLKECQAWEQDSLLPLAQQRIELDLDDGVKVNYLKLQDVLAPIPGLAAKEE